ncbi:hypothetical protein Tco_0712676 [Tanacetum coccineum]
MEKIQEVPIAYSGPSFDIEPLEKKYGMDECVSMSTPMATERLDADLQGTDIPKITRKQSKTSKHGHENQKSTKKKPKNQSRSQKSQASVKSWSTKVNKTQNIPF